jgi:hypothetical protein
VRNINYCSSVDVLSGIYSKLEGNLYLVGNVLAAYLILAQAERTAFLGGWRAFAPANRTNTFGLVSAGRITKSSAKYFFFFASQRSSGGTAVRALSARNANIRHASGAVWRADATANSMEALVAPRVPKGAPLLAAVAAVYLASTSAIGIGFVAISTIVTELLLMRAVLPADWADSRVSSFARVEAKGTILLFTRSAS